METIRATKKDSVSPVSKPNTSFPQDEFDPRPGAVARNGVHRTGRSAWSQVWPFLVVLLVAAALGLGIIQKLMQSPDSVVNEIISEATSSSPAAEEDGTEEDGAASGSDDESASGEDAQNSDDSEDISSEEPVEEEDTATTEPEDVDADDSAAVSKTSSVRVLNASGKQGVAAVAADKLTADGFSSVEATNFEGEKPSASVIYYKGAENQATAEHVGSLLGITNLSEVDSLRADVSVVLR